MTASGGHVFISYRRHDSAAHAGRLYDRLTAAFGDERVFMDVDTLEPGTDYTEAIKAAIAASEVLVVVIGPGWAAATDERNRRRLDDPDDLVRIEIEAALQRGVRVIPVLTDGSVMPSRDQLPESLVPLARRHAMPVRHETFRTDATRLIDAIQRILGATPPPAQPTRDPSAATAADEITVRNRQRIVAEIRKLGFYLGPGAKHLYYHRDKPQVGR
ncbi:MAG: toll/interleukin-1 receptor domain-containing protein, partial [Actinomycetes bacterium]